MKDFFLSVLAGIFVLTVLFGIGVIFNVIDLSYLGWRTNAETHITRQTNAYLTAHQQALRTFKGQYDDLARKEQGITDTDQLNAFHSQERGILKQMREEADLIPNDVQPDIAALLSTNN